MIRANYQRRLSALILGLRPTVAHIYGTDDRCPVDNLSEEGLASWSAGISMLNEDMADQCGSLSSTERWVAEWVLSESKRGESRWADASTVLELLALSLGPSSPDPSYLRPRAFWDRWMRNLHWQRSSIEARRTFYSGDTVELADHCYQLAASHGAPDGMLALLVAFAEVDRPVHHRPDVFRPLATPVERLQLSAVIASAYSSDGGPCRAAQDRLLGQRPALVSRCGRS